MRGFSEGRQRRGRECGARAAGKPDRTGGFTLVEIMVVVVIVGLLAAMAIPAFQHVRERAIASRYVNDFRQFESAFQRYATENGQWPPSAGDGVIPAGMDGYLPTAYTEPTPMGGKYQWVGGSESVILLHSTQATDAVMQHVDAALDDGDLSKGAFVKINGFGYGYRIQ